MHSTFVDNTFIATNTSIFNEGTVNANKIQINQGTVYGTGVFNSSEFFNKGKINPGSVSNLFGTLTFEANLINEGTIELDISKNRAIV